MVLAGRGPPAPPPLGRLPARGVEAPPDPAVAPPPPDRGRLRQARDRPYPGRARADRPDPGRRTYVPWIEAARRDPVGSSCGWAKRWVEGAWRGDPAAHGVAAEEPEPRRAPSLTKIPRGLPSVRPRAARGIRRLRKSRSASAAVALAATAPSRRDDSLVEKQDCIASAIAYCKNLSTEVHFSWHYLQES
ncbi:unnamed protein product [Urochloa humidicola]